MRAMLLALSEEHRTGKRGRPPRRGEDAQFELAMKITRQALQLGGGRGSKSKAIKAVIGVKERAPELNLRAIERGKKALQRRPDAVASAEFLHWIETAPAELRRRLRNVPADRMHLFEHLALAPMLALLRSQSIDGDFPLDLLDDLERALS